MTWLMVPAATGKANWLGTSLLAAVEAGAVEASEVEASNGSLVLAGVLLSLVVIFLASKSVGNCATALTCRPFWES
jgi:hypothetical protein